MMLTDDGFSSMGGGFLFFDLDSCWRVKSDWRLWAMGEGVALMYRQGRHLERSTQSGCLTMAAAEVMRPKRHVPALTR